MIGVYDGEYCGSFQVEVALTCMRLPYDVFSDEDILKPGFGEKFSAFFFGAGMFRTVRRHWVGPLEDSGSGTLLLRGETTSEYVRERIWHYSLSPRV